MICGLAKQRHPCEVCDEDAEWGVAEAQTRLRDEMAAAALTGILSHHGAGKPISDTVGYDQRRKDMADDAYQMADAMLTARKQSCQAL